MFLVSIFRGKESKGGKKYYVLKYNDEIVTWDKTIIFKIMGVYSWNEFLELPFGDYLIDGKENE